MDEFRSMAVPHHALPASYFCLPAIVLALIALLVQPARSLAIDGPESPSEPHNDSALNIRLSSKPIRPPDDSVKKVIVLQDIRAATPMTGDPTKAVILEDDSRRRVIVLSAAQEQPDGRMRAYLLDNVDLEARLPQLTACTDRRRCDSDRTPGVGGLGCVALCLVETLQH